MPWASARPMAGWPIPICTSVSGLEEILQSCSTRRRKSRSSSVLQCTWTCSGPSRPWWSSSGSPWVTSPPQAHPVCRTVGTSSSRAERTSAAVCSNGTSPHSVSAIPIVTRLSSLGSCSRIRRASASRCSCSVNTGSADHRGEVAVGEGGPDPGVAQARERRVGVLGGVVAVREVEQRGDTGVERLQRADVVARVDVLGGAVGRDRHADPAEVLFERPVGAHAAERGLPRVPVGVDEARQQDVPGEVERLGVPRVEARSHGRDRPVLDEHVAGQLTDGVVHRDDVGAPEQQARRCGAHHATEALVSCSSPGPMSASLCT